MVKFDIEKKTMEIKTAHGALVVTAFDDPDYPGVNVDFKLDGHEKHPLSIAMIEDAVPSNYINPSDAVVVRVYGDCNDDEYTDRTEIPIEDIKRFYEEENK